MANRGTDAASSGSESAGDDAIHAPVFAALPPAYVSHYLRYEPLRNTGIMLTCQLANTNIII